jgi:esterase/lipase
MKVVYIIPWFKTNPKESWFQVTWDFFEYKDIMPIFVDIKWKRCIMSQYVEQFKKQILNPNDEIYILWFSFWAIIALLVAREMNIKELFLCSLSPFFKEDYKYLKKWWISMNWKNRNEELRKLSFDEVAKNIKCKTNILYWEKEWIEIERRSILAVKKIKDSIIYKIPNTRHNINERKYLETLEWIINKI